MRIIDKHGQEQPLTWLYEQFGPLEIVVEHGAIMPDFVVRILREIDDIACREIAPEAAATINVRILDRNGQGIPGMTVVLCWPDAPPLKDAGHLGRGVVGRTDGAGSVGFPMGNGAYYDPHKVRGPHQIWIYGPGMSEMVDGLGMIPNTNHRHLDVVFQQRQPDDDPTPAPDPTTAQMLRQAIAQLNAVVARLYQVLDDVEGSEPL